MRVHLYAYTIIYIIPTLRPEYVKRTYFGLFGSPREGSKYPNVKYVCQTMTTVSNTETIDSQFLGTLDP